MTRARRGFTLLEVLVVIALVTILSGVLVMLLKETLHMEQIQAQGFDRILQINALADRFRGDVAQAESAPDEWEGFKTGKGGLILQMPDGSHVVYATQDKRLLRLVYIGKEENISTLPVGSPDVQVEFERGNAKLVLIRLQPWREEAPVPGQAFEIAAALGGDRR